MPVVGTSEPGFVPNHAYALIVDGGTYNGQTITGLGFTKAAHIYYHAMTVYQGPASNFADHEVSIIQSAEDLIGVNLPDFLLCIKDTRPPFFELTRKEMPDLEPP